MGHTWKTIKRWFWTMLIAVVIIFLVQHGQEAAVAAQGHGVLFGIVHFLETLITGHAGIKAPSVHVGGH